MTALVRRSVVHVVDWVLLPYYPTLASIVASTDYFKVIAAAILAEGTYADILYGRVPFNGVVFAPTDT